MHLAVDRRASADEETTLYAVVSNPIDAHTVRPKYGFAGEPVPAEYWIEYRKGQTLRGRLTRFLRYRLLGRKL